MRIILHLDMDAFFAAIEQREDPSLMGKPVIIGHPGSRGVVATCSYEAREFGVHSAMPSVRAEKLCPGGIWIRGKMDLYREVSRSIFETLGERIPVVEQVSVDEAYGDLGGLVKTMDQAVELARGIKQEIRHKQSLTASIGIAPCRFLAKIASDLEKPDGLTLIRPDQIVRRIHPLSVRKIPGVGPKMAERLARLGIRFIGEVAAAEEAYLRRHLGTGTAAFLAARAKGKDDTPIQRSHARRSISEERTYLEDLTDSDQIRRELLARSEGVARSLRSKGLCGRTVVLKARDQGFRTLTRSRTLDEPTELTEDIFRAAWQLWEKKVDFRGRGVRLLGVGVSGLVKRDQVPRLLFPDQARERSREIARAADEVRRRFGKQAIGPGRLVKRPNPGPQGGNDSG